MEEKPNYTPVIIVGLFITAIVLVCGLTNYKSEVLKCSKTNDICKIEKTNLFNMKSEKKIVKYSEISGVSYFRQRVKGNRYGKGYKEYLLAFDTKNGNQVQIFTKSYYEKSEITGVVKILNSKLKETNETFEYSRDN